MAPEKCGGAVVVTKSAESNVSYVEQDSHKGWTYYRGKFRIVIIIIAVVCTVYVCRMSSQRYINTCVQTVIQCAETHISTIPFPAVTICPVKNVEDIRNTHIYRQFVKSIVRSPQDEPHLVTLLELLQHISWPWASSRDVQTILHSLQNASFRDFLNSHSDLQQAEMHDLIDYSCEEIFERCSWRQMKKPCCHILKKIVTSRGVCYAFNSVLVKDPIPNWPWINAHSGMHSGLRVYIRQSGLKSIVAMIHDPLETFSSDIIYLKGERVNVHVQPLYFVADDEIKVVPLTDRHCLLSHEMKRTNNSISICLSNCRRSYIAAQCNCTLDLWTRQGGREEDTTSKSTHPALPPCSTAAEHLECIYKNRAVLTSTTNIIEMGGDNEPKIVNCGCFPSCNYVKYRTSNYFDMVNSESEQEFVDFQVQYDHDSLFTYRSTLRFTLLDLIVSYGGVAGLFLGFSLVGIIDSICAYFLSKRR